MAEKTEESKERLMNAEGARVVNERSRQVWVVWIVIAAFVALIGIVAAAIVFTHVLHNRLGQTAMQPAFQRIERGFQHGTFYQWSSTTDGPTTTTTTQKYTYTTGVVTQVNSDNIVVAGNGKSQTIKTNASTKYDGNKPAVNDTVRIIGTADDSNAITATEITVINN